jgi:hypothetical protein
VCTHESCCHLVEGQQPAFAEPVVARFEAIPAPDVTDDDGGEVLVGAGAEAALVQEYGDLRLGMVIQQPVDLGHGRGAGLPHLPRRRRERPVERRRAPPLNRSAG